MSPSEVALVVEAKRPKNRGGLHEDDFYELERRREEMEASGVKMI